MMQFALLTPEGELYNAQVEEIQAQGSEGNLGILPQHISLVTPLQVAPLSVKVQGQLKRFAVYGGILQVTPDKVTAFADHAELPERIDRARASARKEELEAKLQRESDPSQRADLKRQLDITHVQLEVLS